MLGERLGVAGPWLFTEGDSAGRAPPVMIRRELALDCIQRIYLSPYRPALLGVIRNRIGEKAADLLHEDPLPHDVLDADLEKARRV